jgi:putative ABC transport system permease protein
MRLRAVFRSSQAEAQLEREVAAHLSMLEDEFRRRGLSSDEARLAARRQFGGIDQAKEQQRDARSFVWIEDQKRDIRYAVRTLAKSPGFTLAAILTLAIGIGGSTAVFSLIDAVLLRPLPVPNADRVVMLYEDASKFGFPESAVAPIVYGAWAGQNDVFEALAAVTEFGAVLQNHGEPLRVGGRRVTRSLFDVLGAHALIGRTFRPDEDRPGGPKVVVLSFGLWQRRFGGDHTLVGRTISLNSEPYLVVGVMPKTFQFLDDYVGLWVPAAFAAEELTGGAHYLTVVGRMKPSLGQSGMRANLDAAAARAVQRLPEHRDPPHAVVVPLKEALAGSARTPMLVLLAAVGVVLLITCANLASLLLSRAATRGHEIALRGALGASRGRVIRQLLTESAVLSASGLILGIVLARWSLAFLEQLVPPAMTLFTSPSLNVGTLAVAAAVSIATGLLFGLAPALAMTRTSLTDALKSSGRSTQGSHQGRGLFVVAEVAMTMVLLVAAGLLLQTFHKMRYADLGVRPEGLLTLRTALPYEDFTRRVDFYDRVLDGLQRLPGVVSAGYTTSVPLEWKGATNLFTIEGRAPVEGMAYDANHREISAGYFKTIGTPLIRGRYFETTDTERSMPVVIINQTMARKYWPEEDPVGHRIGIEVGFRPDPWLTIVGVVGDVRQMGLDVPPRPELYLPYRQIATQPWFAPRDLVVRTTGDPMALVGDVKRIVYAVDPAQPVSNIRTLGEVLDEDVASRRVGTTLLVAFAGFALVLAVVGIYGVIAYFVAQHVPEMGLRIALGAQHRDILRLVVMKGLRLALAGVALGIVLGAGVTRLMASLLYGVGATDMATFAGGAALLLLLAFVASYLPARRATSVDPIVALRTE